MKLWVHVAAALALWITAVSLMSGTQNSLMPMRLDQVHTYSKQKVPLNYQSAKSTINSLFTANNPVYNTPLWDDQAGTGCVGMNYFNGTPNVACFNKRTSLVLQIKQAMGCDVNRAPACNCLTQVLRGVAMDNSTNNTAAAFTGTGKNLAGYGGYVQASIDRCRWLYRNPTVAVENNSTIVRPFGHVFYLATLTLANMLDQLLLPAYTSKWSPAYAAYARILLALLSLLTGVVGNMVIESDAPNVILVNSMVPLLLLFWHEYLAPALTARPWLHPYYFSASLGTIATLALVENGVLDYDNLVTELIKAQMTAYLYTGLVWFYMYERMEGMSKDIFHTKPMQTSVFIVTSLAVGIWGNTLAAPYTTSPMLNYLWFMPQAFVLLAFGGVIWLSGLRFQAVFGPKKEGKQAPPDRWHMGQECHYASVLHLGLVFFILLYFAVIYTETNLTIVTQATYNSIQLNANQTWQIPS